MWISPTGTSGGGGGGGGGGFVAADLVALPQAANAAMTISSLAYVVTDPTGTPTSTKSTLGRLGALNTSWVDEVLSIVNPFSAVGTADFTIGTAFIAARAGQSCVGVRFYWAENAVRNIKVRIGDLSTGSTLATGTVATSGTAGIFSASFAAQSLTEGTVYYVSVYNTDAAPNKRYIVGPAGPRVAAGGELISLTALRRYRDFVMVGNGLYAIADVAPTNNHAYIYPVEPLISG